MKAHASRPKRPIRLANDYLAVVYCLRGGSRICDGIFIASKAKEIVAQVNATPDQTAGFKARTMPVELHFPGNGVGVYEPIQLPK